MARTALTPTQLTRAGTAPATTAALDATNGNSVPNDGHTWIVVDNTDTASHTLTVHLVGGTDGQGITPKTITVAASTTGQMFGPWPLDSYGTTLLLNVDDAQLKAAAYTLGM